MNRSGIEALASDAMRQTELKMPGGMAIRSRQVTGQRQATEERVAWLSYGTRTRSALAEAKTGN